MPRTRRARRYFNPHPHTEGDPDRLPNLFQLVGISTHTLARRVTAKAHKKAARFCSKGTALRRNCLAVVHERAAVPLLQAVFCRVILHFYGAKVPWECWALMVRTGTAGFMIRCATPSGRLPAGSRRFVRNAVFFVHTDCPSNKTAGYPTPRP